MQGSRGPGSPFCPVPETIRERAASASCRPRTMKADPRGSGYRRTAFHSFIYSAAEQSDCSPAAHPVSPLHLHLTLLPAGPGSEPHLSACAPPAPAALPTPALKCAQVAFYTETKAEHSRTPGQAVLLSEVGFIYSSAVLEYNSGFTSS